MKTILKSLTESEFNDYKQYSVKRYALSSPLAKELGEELAYEASY